MTRLSPPRLGSSDQYLYWQLPAYEIKTAGGSTPSRFSLHQWDVTLFTRREFEARAHATFRTWLAGELDSCEAEAKKQGFVKTPEVREWGRHLKWMVDYQVKGLSQASVAKKYRADRVTIAHALKTTAARLGLHIRPQAKAGRRPKNRI